MDVLSLPFEYFSRFKNEAFWNIDVGFQMWFPSSTFLIFLSSLRFLQKMTLIDFFILLLFFQLFLPPPSFLLLCFSFSHFSVTVPISYSVLSFCVFLVLYFLRRMWQQLIFLSFFQLSVFTHFFLCLAFPPLVLLFACSECADFQHWRR